MNRVSLKVAGTTALALCAAWPRPTRAHESTDDWHFETGGTCSTCTGTPRFHWDTYNELFFFGATQRGAIETGTANNVAGCMVLDVDGVNFHAGSYTLAADGRGFTTDEVATSGVRVTRDLHFPAADLDYGRWVDTFRNTGAADATVTVRYSCVYNGCAADRSGSDCTVD